MDKYLAPLINHMELYIQTEKYDYYIDKKKKEIAIYNGHDIMILSTEELGDLVFYGDTSKKGGTL